MQPELIIGGTPYKVVEVEQIDHDPGIWGQTVYETHQIMIKKSLDDVRKRQTIIHEALHATFFESGYESHEEEMVNRLSGTLSGIVLSKEKDISFLEMPNEQKLVHLISFDF